MQINFQSDKSAVHLHETPMMRGNQSSPSFILFHILIAAQQPDSHLTARIILSRFQGYEPRLRKYHILTFIARQNRSVLSVSRMGIALSSEVMAHGKRRLDFHPSGYAVLLCCYSIFKFQTRCISYPSIPF